MKKTLRGGEGYKEAKNLSKVKASYKISTADGKVLKEQAEPVDFVVDNADVPDVIDTCIRKMKDKEQAEFEVAASVAYGSEGNAELGVEADQALVVEVDVASIEFAKESWDLEGAQKLETAEARRIMGNDWFKKVHG